MEVGELAEDDLHHAEADDVGACVLGAVGVVPAPVEAVGLEDSPAQWHQKANQIHPSSSARDIIWFSLVTTVNQISTKVIN
jgi:hypothetical protein